MATKSDSYELNVSTSQAQQNLARLNQSLSKTSEVFGGLKNLVVGFALGGFIKQTFDMANSLTDSAKAAGLSTATLLAFSRAVQVSGGTIQSAAGGVDNFSQAVDSAATGGAKAQDQFRQLGITLTDLRTLSEEEIFKRMIAGLGTIDDTSKRAAIAMSLLGKAGKGVEFANVADKMKQMADESERMSKGFDRASDARENVSRTMTLFQSQLLLALEPISKLTNNLLESGRAVEIFLKYLIGIGLAIASFTLFGRAVQLIRSGFALLVTTWATLTEVISVGTAGVRGFGLILENLGLVGFAGKLRIVGTLLAEFGTWVMANIPGLAVLAAGIYAVVDALMSGVTWLKSWLGLTKETTVEEKKQVEAKREIIDAYKKQRQEIEYTSIAFAKANDDIMKQINLDNELIGKSKDYADSVRAQEDIFKRNTDEILKLRKAKSELSAEELRGGLGANYDAQIKKMEQVTIADAERVDRATRNANRIQMLDQVRVYGIQNQIDKEGQLKTLQDDIAKSTLTEIEKKYYDIDSAARASAKSAVDAEQARVGRQLSPEEAAKYYSESIKGVVALKKAQGEQYDESRKFSTGWQQAMNEYVANATNGAATAASLFQKATQGMEDAFVNFAKTGKFEWKNFVGSLTEELLRSQVKQLMANMFTGIGGNSTGGGGNIIGGITKLLGFADGGLIPTNGPVIVGERGPEILSGAGGRTVIPNHALGGGGGAVTLNISAVDAPSFQALVARNPQFIHAVAEMGRRSIPGGGR